MRQSLQTQMPGMLHNATFFGRKFCFILYFSMYKYLFSVHQLQPSAAFHHEVSWGFLLWRKAKADDYCLSSSICQKGMESPKTVFLSSFFLQKFLDSRKLWLLLLFLLSERYESQELTVIAALALLSKGTESRGYSYLCSFSIRKVWIVEADKYFHSSCFHLKIWKAKADGYYHRWASLTRNLTS